MAVVLCTERYHNPFTLLFIVYTHAIYLYICLQCYCWALRLLAASHNITYNRGRIRSVGPEEELKIQT